MREQSKDKDRLQHILECIENVFQFLDGKSYEEMANDLPVLKQQVEEYFRDL